MTKREQIEIAGKMYDLPVIINVGAYEDQVKALNTLFPGKNAYLDDIDVVFEDSPETQGYVTVEKKDWWKIIMNDGTIHEIKVIGASFR
jgi:hypothetical protein